MYVSNKFSKFCKIVPACTLSNNVIAILTVSLRKPGLKHMNISVLYKPPKTPVKEITDYLNSILPNLMPRNTELWILGDFNTDFLVRDNANTKKSISFFRKNGLKQLITDVTRPNKYRGSCIDWIITNSPFVLLSGVSNVLISDHLAIHCIRKKKRENTRNVYRVIRDQKNYSRDNFVTLLRAYDWETFRRSTDPNEQWDIIFTRALDILTIMCPYKRYKQREVLKPWLNADIYREIRYRDKCMKLFRITGHQCYFRLACQARNRVNGMVDRAKSCYFKNVLNDNSKNPNKKCGCDH